MNENNNIFNQSISDRYENNLSHLIYFKRLCDKVKVDIGTHHTIKPESADLFIFLDYPKDNDFIFNIAKSNNKKAYLITFENSFINPKNFDRNLHHFFSRVFTWNDNFIDNKKYFLLSYKFFITDVAQSKIFTDRKLLTLIAANKAFIGSNELYSLRRKIINWLNTHHPSSFEFYGREWRMLRFAMNSPLRILNRLNLPNIINHSLLLSYKGECLHKKEILQSHVFCICFENSSNEYGYISEKIFDCFFNGCIPIYYGAPNIQDYIPEECYVDFRKFKSIEKVFEFISKFDQGDYDQYIDNINKFLVSDKGKFFSHKNFARTLIRSVFN
jgi:hypothetical protein